MSGDHHNPSPHALGIVAAKTQKLLKTQAHEVFLLRLQQVNNLSSNICKQRVKMVATVRVRFRFGGHPKPKTETETETETENSI
jgi:hypothetical protein